VGGKKIKAVMQPNKTGFLFVLCSIGRTAIRVSIIEPARCRKASCPVEHTSHTQPFQLSRRAFDRQGITVEEMIDSR